jgi:hypothetical protein
MAHRLLEQSLIAQGFRSWLSGGSQAEADGRRRENLDRFHPFFMSIPASPHPVGPQMRGATLIWGCTHPFLRCLLLTPGWLRANPAFLQRELSVDWPESDGLP